MRYAKILYFDTGNARGLSTVLFVQGCKHNCDGCFNPETHDFNGGHHYTEEAEQQIIESIKNPHISNLVISGGDPCYQSNIVCITSLCKKAKQVRPDINIIIYTGFYMVELLQMDAFSKLTQYINIVIDAPFNEKQSTSILDYRGSTNQNAYIIVDGKTNVMSDYYFKEGSNYNKDLSINDLYKIARNSLEF